MSVSVNKTTRCHNTEAHNVRSKILASLSLSISYEHVYPMHTCASDSYIDLQVNPTRKQTDIAVLPRCIALLSPPHMFADTSIYHTDYHSSRTSICKWLHVTEQATGDDTSVKSDIKHVIGVCLSSLFSGPLPKAKTNENPATNTKKHRYSFV
jgi:hypothetical protein